MMEYLNDVISEIIKIFMGEESVLSKIDIIVQNTGSIMTISLSSSRKN